MNECQWEALAELQLQYSNLPTETVTEIYCLCSRVFIRNASLGKPFDVVNTDNETVEEDLGQKKKKLIDSSKEVENSVSCYCSASHADNISADEHDSLRSGPILSRGLQSSDSGADLSETFVTEQQETWEHYWSKNGEKLIWTSWISKYSSYINPEYQLPKAKDQTDATQFSFQSSDIKNIIENDVESDNKKIIDGWNPLSPPSVDVPVSPQDNELLLTSRSYSATTDSMTNVTKLTLSSIDLSASDLSSSSNSSLSESSLSPVSSSRSSESEYDPGTTIDADQYWQQLWKRHFEEQYCEHYHNYIESREKVTSESNHHMSESHTSNRRKRHDATTLHSVNNLLTHLKVMDENEENVENRELLETNQIPQKDGDKEENLNTSIMADNNKLAFTEDTRTVKKQLIELGLPTSLGPQKTSRKREDFVQNTNNEKSVAPNTYLLKRTHESDSEETSGSYNNRLLGAFSLMGYVWSPEESQSVVGDVTFRKKHIRLQNRQLKMKNSGPKHTYFHDDGDQISTEENDHVLPIELESSSDDEESIDPELIKGRNHLKKKSCDECVSTKDVLEDIVTRSRKFMEARGISVQATETKSNDHDKSSDCDSNSLKRKKKRKRSKKSLSTVIPSIVIENPELKKYWLKRFQLFSKFDYGILLDYESWFSVTPERVAKYIADRCRCDIIIDAFCGAGGNTIQFAQTCQKVIAIDIDPEKIRLAKHNADIYEVGDRIEFIVGDYTQLYQKLKADVVFLSPPWGGPKYIKTEKYDLETMLEPIPLSNLLEKTRHITNNIAAFVPRNSDVNQLAVCAGPEKQVEVEQNFLDKTFVSITAFYGNLINGSG